MKAVLRWLLTAAGLAQSVAVVCADEPLLLQHRGAATLRIAAAAEKGQLVLALTDLLAIQIEVEGDASLEVQEPSSWVKGPWLARPAGAAERRNLGPKIIWKQTLNVEPSRPGETALLVEPLRYRSGDGAWQTATWSAVAVRVTSRLIQADVNSARDITSIEELPSPPPRASHGSWAVGVLVGAIVVLALWVVWRRRRRQYKSRMAPEAWALYELQRLQSLGLPGQGKQERFGTLLAGLVRRYLENRFHLPARRQTTAEFLAALDQRAILTDQRAFLESFLRRCDLLKFAPLSASADECRDLAAQAAQFISQQQQPSATSGTAGAT